MIVGVKARQIFPILHQNRASIVRTDARNVFRDNVFMHKPQLSGVSEKGRTIESITFEKIFI